MKHLSNFKATSREIREQHEAMYLRYKKSFEILQYYSIYEKTKVSKVNC